MGIRTRLRTNRIYIPFTLFTITVILMLWELGVNKNAYWTLRINWLYHFIVFFGISNIIYKYFSNKNLSRAKVWLADVLVLIFSSWLIYHFLFTEGYRHEPPRWVYACILLLFLREMSLVQVVFRRSFLNPAQLFVLSFLFLIFSGSSLLMLPNATIDGNISFLDALFTSTSAVCVTGLAVVDTGKYFTVFGQVVILFLIQLGGIGIMTVTSYFSYYFRGGSSYETHLTLKDMVNSDKLGEVFGVLKKIILLTLGIEAVGAAFIYFNLNNELFKSIGDQVYFSVFHAVSSFCNAGFSTLSNSLYEEGFRFNYPFHMIITLLLISGGIGFPIMFNFIHYIRVQVRTKLIPLGLKRKVVHKPWVININTRIVLYTTAILLFAGTVAIYIFEYNNTLAEHSGAGKVVTAFLGSASPRTAGFNSVNMGELLPHTVMIILFLMWVGASPGSTGGGIKTSTLAIGTLNFISLARGKDRVEVFRREIAATSLARAFAIISLSLIVVGFSTFLLVLFEPEKELIALAFESFSAYSTVGLSLNLTPSLGFPSKVVIIVVMFIGRVSMLTILVAFFKAVRNQKYRYPTETILIN